MNPAMLVLYISGYQDSQVGAGEVERARIFLQKPFTPDALLTKVRELLDRPAAERVPGAQQ
jgi:DNA-binding response OmpR family regulator